MTLNQTNITKFSDRSLAGATGWIITDGKAGMVVQAQGVADALGLDWEEKIVPAGGFWRTFAPWGPVNPMERFGRKGRSFAPPWPDVAIATGRASIPYVRTLKRHARDSTFAVVLQDPKTSAGIADLIWVPGHDQRRGPNVITTLTSPHSFSQSRLSQLRGKMPDDIAALPGPRVAVALGGKNAVYKFTEEDDVRLGECLCSLASLGASFMVTPSRRSHKRLIAAVETATRGAPRVFWEGEGDNPYPDFLASADILVVTADSVNMCGEAAATGRPVYVFSPSGGSAKFKRFHDGLREHGATRPLPEFFNSLPAWEYAPLDSAVLIAREIEQRVRRG